MQRNFALLNKALNPVLLKNLASFGKKQISIRKLLEIVKTANDYMQFNNRHHQWPCMYKSN